MSKDIFGYTKVAKGIENIASPSLVAVSVNGKINLAQSCTINYQRELQPVFELGSENIWMTGGKSQGDCNIERAVGEGAVWGQFSNGDPCTAQTIVVSKGSVSCGEWNGTVRCTGCLLQNVSVSAQVGSLVVTESAKYNVGCVANS
jgi:hypothetical protein